MNTQTVLPTNRRMALRGLVACIALALTLLCLPVTSEAASYFVAGRAYSADPLPEGETPEADPLAGIPADQVVGEGLVATVPRNLVRVRVLRASDGSELDSYITRKDGGFLASFSAPAGGTEVRFVVEELATSQQLVESEPTIVTEPVSVRYLLVPEVPTEITEDREFATAPSPGDHTAIFTRVGKIEVSTNVGGSTVDLIGTDGLANVDPTVAGQLAIPAYEDSPFGGNLFLFGAFSANTYGSGACYTIEVTQPGNPAAGTEFITDELWKTRYTVNFATGTVDASREKLGPKAMNGQPNCYELTPLSTGPNVFWSYPDLLALWRTGGINGLRNLEIRLHGPPSATFVPVSQTEVNLHLDNVAPVADFGALGGGVTDEVRVYTPGPVPPSADLLAAPLGSLPTDYGGSGDLTCEILSLQPPTANKHIALKASASQANGFLRTWSIAFHRNDDSDAVVMGKRYDGATNSMVDLPGVLVSSSQSSTSGFTDRFLYLDSDHLEPAGDALAGCGYRFVIRAWKRTTDGYHYIGYRHDQDIHHVLKSPAP